MNSAFIKRTTFAAFVLITALGCEHDAGLPPEPRHEGWIFMGLSDKEIHRVRLFGDYLYACSGRDGLYRINVQQNDENWEFLGLADSTLPRRIDGVRDVAVLEDTILVAYSPRYGEPGIYRAVAGEYDWQPSNNEIDLGISILAPSPFHTKTIFAGSLGGRVYKSTDFGRNWNAVWEFFLTGPDIVVIRFHPILTNEIWVGGQGFDSAELARSTDGGENWQDMKQIIKTILFQQHGDSLRFPQTFSENAFDSEDGNMMYLGSDWLWKSQDGGNSWSLVLDSFVWTVADNPSNPNEIILSSDFIYKTLDGGNSWETIEMPIPNSGPGFLAMDWGKRILYTTVFNRPLEIDESPGVYKMFF